MSEYPKLLLIDYADFPIETATDVELLCAELQDIAEEYEGYWPVFRILPIEKP